MNAVPENNSGGLSWQESFTKYLGIRVQYEQERNHYETDLALERVYGSDAFPLLEARHYDFMEKIMAWSAWDEVRSLGFDSDGGSIHYLLSSVPELVEAWNEGVKDWGQVSEQEKWEAKTAADELVRKSLIEEKIAKNDWTGLGMPDPGELFADLLKGEACDVGGHRLSPDEHGIWITNPYGIDCGLLQDVTISDVEKFMLDMARGVEYGPVPY